MAKKPSALHILTTLKRKIISKRKWIVRILALSVAVLISSLVIIAIVVLPEQAKIYKNVNALPNNPIAIVFGPGISRPDQPMQMLQDREAAGIQLYLTGKVKKLEFSGNPYEVKLMHDKALQSNVPTDAIITDNEGFRTYDTCYRAVHTYNISEAILVTQQYHLSRALYLCNSLGVNSIGYASDKQNYGPVMIGNNGREVLAELEAWLDINLIKPQPDLKP